MPNKSSPNSVWYVYILECIDRSLYTGCTNNITKRLAVHNSGEGAKYTRSRLPVTVVYVEKATNRSVASKREAAIKKMNRFKKKQLIAKFDRD